MTAVPSPAAPARGFGVLHGLLTVRALLRRRLTLAVMVALPIALYLASHDAVGRSVRALVFGVSWAVSTVAFFAATAARDLEPRLALAGRSRPGLLGARLVGLLALSLVLVAGFWVMVALDQPVRSLAAVGVDFAVTAAVAVTFGTAIGSVVGADLEGTLVLFFFAGLQAVANPFDQWTRILPFWSSRELGTWAIDGPALGSPVRGLIHAGATAAVCLLVCSAGLTRHGGQGAGRRQRP